MSILIVVPVYNRKKITELSLYQTNRFKGDGNKLVVYNDYSTEYDNDFLSEYCDEVIKMPTKMGVQHLRWHQLRKFLEQDEFDMLYLTDNDVIHDPNYISKLNEYYGKYMLKDGQKLPVCLYNTVYHLNAGNVLTKNEHVSLRRTAPGVSMMFDKSMVRTIVDKLNQRGTDPDYAWDYRALEMLGLPWITSEISYLEHFGASGLHSFEGRAGMDKDRAINPTKYLQELRESVIDYVLFEGIEKPTL
jgi:hypothetical protein